MSKTNINTNVADDKTPSSAPDNATLADEEIADNESETLLLNQRESIRDMLQYCENHAIFFYHQEKQEKRLIPKRKDSSRVTLDGLVRHRGSMLNLLYSVPDLREIQQLG